jgi:putative Ca2+/H+ antiporter (TMEM165/GDT1 family)
MEIGSASNFTIAAMANSSNRWFLVLIAGCIGIFVADFIAVKLGGLLQKLPISSNTFSGLVMVILGLVFLFKES